MKRCHWEVQKPQLIVQIVLTAKGLLAQRGIPLGAMAKVNLPHLKEILHSTIDRQIGIRPNGAPTAKVSTKEYKGVAHHINKKEELCS